MTTTLNATTSSGLVATPDNSGAIALQNNGVTGLNIDASGRVTTPLQPIFYAYTFSNDTQSATKTFSNVPINVGSCYNNSNGRFTAPVAGVYEFRTSYIGVNGTVTRLYLYLNNSNIYNGDANQLRIDATGTGTELPFGEHSLFVSLTVNDYITLYVTTDSGAALTNISWGTFFGRLIG